MSIMKCSLSFPLTYIHTYTHTHTHTRNILLPSTALCNLMSIFFCSQFVWKWRSPPPRERSVLESPSSFCVKLLE
ncbi:hypothetical protein J4Q44_G00390170 [Coregonus suidteri]|uniref:Uncharacterized protein n=1 Tax=Coregonus suidteri TaxID=861788 RepID=A0AAN8Q3R4_9TELE